MFHSLQNGVLCGIIWHVLHVRNTHTHTYIYIYTNNDDDELCE